jgi:hypothetical protein
MRLMVSKLALWLFEFQTQAPAFGKAKFIFYAPQHACGLAWKRYFPQTVTEWKTAR